MSKGTNLIFNATPHFVKERRIDIQNSTFKIGLISDPVTSLLVSETDPGFGDGNINEVAAGGNYTAGGQTLTLANVSASSVFTMKLDTGTHSGGTISWAQDGSNPTNAKTAVIYDSSVVSALAICYYDITDDGGTTAIDMQGRDLEVNIGAAGNAGEILKLSTSN